MYQIIFRSRAMRSIELIDDGDRRVVISALNLLAHDPFLSPHVRRIAGVRYPAYRLRVGRWRVLYLLLTKRQTIEVIDIWMKKSTSDYRRRMRFI